MTNFLVSEENEKGFLLEDILISIRKDILERCLKITDDKRPEALHVLSNNMKILNLLSDAIALADDSTKTLDRAFGPHGKTPRIGTE
ncbi:MAG: histidine kinase [Rhodospirillaceae bacterium]|nr:histidine kinase [Rhodospirillaceae bacterium]MBT5566091.1 histidine kinase [Rhodospirillaceae bacterium]MBT7450569.1 histidine kinase [Rhodospirillaceae bacterium]